jgi:hypothetical protein
MAARMGKKKYATDPVYRERRKQYQRDYRKRKKQEAIELQLEHDLDF